MDRASDYGSEGWEFDSLRARESYLGFHVDRHESAQPVVMVWSQNFAERLTLAAGSGRERIGARSGHARPSRPGCLGAVTAAGAPIAVSRRSASPVRRRSGTGPTECTTS